MPSPAAPGFLLRLCAARGAERPPAPWENRERGGRGEEDGVGEEGRRGEMRGREAAGERGRRGGARGQKDREELDARPPAVGA